MSQDNNHNDMYNIRILSSLNAIFLIDKINKFNNLVYIVYSLHYDVKGIHYYLVNRYS